MVAWSPPPSLSTELAGVRVFLSGSSPLLKSEWAAMADYTAQLSPYRGN